MIDGNLLKWRKHKSILANKWHAFICYMIMQ